MASKIIVHSPDEYMGIQKLFVYINGVDQGLRMGRSETQEIDIPNEAYIVGKYGTNRAIIMESTPVPVRDESVTELQFSIVQGTWKGSLSTNIVSESPLSSYRIQPVEKAVFEFDGGVGDKLIVFEDRVVIKHKGVLNFMAMGVHGDKIVYLTDITGIQFKPCGMTNGHLQFSMLGGNESKGGILSAASDENTITFTSKKDHAAKEVHEYLSKRLRELKTVKNAPVIQTAPTSAADELKKFNELLHLGIITQEEFDAKKKQLLGL